MSSTSNPAAVARPTKRYRLRAAGILLCGLLVLAGGAWFWLRPGPPSPPAVETADLDPAIAAAIEEARAEVLRLPRSAPAWGRLGLVLAAHEFLAEAVTCFAQAEQLDPREPRWPYHQGVALSQGNLIAGLPKLRRAVTLCDAVPDAPRLRLADLLVGQGLFEEAEENYRRILARDSANARAHLGLARLALQRGENAPAAEHLAYALKDERTRKTAALLRASLLARQGKPAEAEAERKQAAVLPDDPSWPDPYMAESSRLRVGRQANLERADERLRRGQSAEALRLLLETVRAYPESDWGWYLLGKAAFQESDWPTAERALRQAAKLTPAAPEIQFYLGAVRFQQGDLSEAAACFQRAVELKPDYDLAYYNLGLCRNRQGNRKAAIAAFRAALRLRASLFEAHVALAETLLRDGQRTAAGPHVRQAVLLRPQNPQALRLLACYLP